MQTIVVILLAVVLALAIQYVSIFLKNAINVVVLTPFSLRALGREDLFAILLTGVSSIVAFFFAVAFGAFYATIAALLGRRENQVVRAASGILKITADFAYIVPAVVSVAAVLSLSYGLFGPGHSGIAILAILAGVTFLSGYQVFGAIYFAAIEPPDRHKELVEALYVNTGRWLSWAIREIVVIRRLADASIDDIVHALERAFHLAIVGVVIVEMMHPGLYGLIFPQASGVAPSYMSGVGGILQKTQDVHAFERTMGFVWALFILDFVVVSGIAYLSRLMYLRHSR